MNATYHALNGKAFLIALAFVLFFFVGAAFCQDIPPQDAEAIRKIIAERNFYKSVSEEQAKQAEAWKASAASWRALYEAEKERADTVQGGRIEELRTALDEMKSANAELTTAGALYKQQLAADAEYIKRLERRVESLKVQRWIFSAASFAAGTLIGGRVQF